LTSPLNSKRCEEFPLLEFLEILKTTCLGGP
jgi:hypothetical protein